MEPPGQLVRKFSIETACELAAVREACQQSRAALAGAGLGEEELGHWELMLAEAGNNAVRYAPRSQQRPPVRFEFSVSNEWVEARVVDHTTGFDLPEEVELPPTDSETGRGLYLIKALSDRVAYFRGHGENHLVLKKKRMPPGTRKR